MFAALAARRLGAAAAAGVVAAIGASHSQATCSGSSAAYSWGSGLYGETGHGKECTGEPLPAKVEIPGEVRVVAASVSGSTSAAVTAGNALYTWGCGGRGDGRLGFGDIGSQNQLTPRLVEAMPEGVVDVRMGETFGLALTGESARRHHCRAPQQKARRTHAPLFAAVAAVVLQRAAVCTPSASGRSAARQRAAAGTACPASSPRLGPRA